MSTVNVSFPKQLLREIDAAAKRESRSRSELLRAASRIYIDRRQRWDHLLASLRSEAKRRGLRPEDVETAIAEARATKRPAR